MKRIKYKLKSNPTEGECFVGTFGSVQEFKDIHGSDIKEIIYVMDGPIWSPTYQMYLWAE
jgi:hypothetical protein